MKEKKKSKEIWAILKKLLPMALFIIVLLLTDAVSSGLRVVSGIIEGQHGKPSFVTPQFQIYALLFDLLFIAAYYFLGRWIPIKNRIARGIAFTTFFIGTDYLPQVLGMAGGESTIISAEAMSIATILVDSIGYLLKGMVLGWFLIPKNPTSLKYCAKSVLFKACMTSMILFPLLLGGFEFMAGQMYPQMYCANSFGITEETTIRFYIIFYLFQAVSGATIPIFYRFSEYNRTTLLQETAEKNRKWLSFATIYGCFLWLPVVVIVMFFGVDVYATIGWGAMMVMAIFADSFVFTKFMKG